MIMREVGGLGPGLGLHGALPASVSAFASSSPALFSSTRGGRPAIAITARRRGRSGAFLSASVVAAEAQQGAGPGVPRVGPPPQQAVGKELSESDARVLRELMNDADFMESLRERNVRISPDVLDSVDRAAPAAPTYSSQTLKAAADLSLSWGGFVAKLSDALESAAIYVSNKALTDVTSVMVFASYAAKSLTTGALQLASAATQNVALLPGSNSTTAESMGSSLWDEGLNPFELLQSKPRMLGSLEGNGDTKKRLDKAYRRTQRSRGSIAQKVIGALPSALLQADDLAYELEQEVRYEEPGARISRLIRKAGIKLGGGGEVRGTLEGGVAANHALPQEAHAAFGKSIVEDSDGGNLGKRAPAGSLERWIFDELAARPVLLLEELAHSAQLAQDQSRRRGALSLPLKLASRLMGGSGDPLRQGMRERARVEGLLAEEMKEVLDSVAETAQDVRSAMQEELSVRERLSSYYDWIVDELENLAWIAQDALHFVERSTPSACRALSQLEATREGILAARQIAVDDASVWVALKDMKELNACTLQWLQHASRLAELVTPLEERIISVLPHAPASLLQDLEECRDIVHQLRSELPASPLPEMSVAIPLLSKEFHDMEVAMQPFSVAAAAAPEWLPSQQNADGPFSISEAQQSQGIVIPAQTDAISAADLECEASSFVMDAQVVGVRSMPLAGYATARVENMPGVNSYSMVTVVEEGVIDIEESDFEEVEDAQKQSKRALLKTLDVAALLIERVVIKGIPSAYESSRIAVRRVRQTVSPEGRRGWRLLRRVSRPK